MSDDRPRVLIEDWLPVRELSIESRREAAPIPGQFPKLKTLHQWWARRPIVASAATVLGGLLPAWSPDLAASSLTFRSSRRRRTTGNGCLYLVGIWGDPVAAKKLSNHAKATGTKLKENPYTYRPAFKNSLDEPSVRTLHRVLEATWGKLPTVADVTAGGGSIPWTSLRLGLPTYANDLNSVAATILTASLEIPAKYGTELSPQLRHWGNILVERAGKRLKEYLPGLAWGGRHELPVRARRGLPSHGSPRPPRARLVAAQRRQARGCPHGHRSRRSQADDSPVRGASRATDIDFDADKGIIAAGSATSPYDDVVIDGDYIKCEAQAGRMTYLLYAVVTEGRKDAHSVRHRRGSRGA